MRAIRVSLLASVVVAAVVFSATTVSNAALITYRLKKGEGLADVSARYNVPLATLIKLNRKRLPRPADPNYVFTGMSVVVPVKDAKEQGATRPGIPTGPEQTAPASAPKPAVLPSKPQPQKPVVKPPAAKESGPPMAEAPDNAAPSASKPSVTGARTAAGGKALKGADAAKQGSGAPKPLPLKPADGRGTVQKNGSGSGGNGSYAIFPPEKTIGTMSREARSRFERVTGLRWDPALVLVAVLLLVSVALLVWIASAIRRRTKAADAEAPGDLVLMAARDLGKNTRFFWFKASEKDVFVVTGAEAKVVTAEAETSLQSAAAAPSSSDAQAVEPGSAPGPQRSRRPRKPSPPTANGGV